MKQTTWGILIVVAVIVIINNIDQAADPKRTAWRTESDATFKEIVGRHLDTRLNEIALYEKFRTENPDLAWVTFQQWRAEVVKMGLLPEQPPRH